MKLALAVWSGSIAGIRCHVLDDGTRIVDAADVGKIFEDGFDLDAFSVAYKSWMDTPLPEEPDEAMVNIIVNGKTIPTVRREIPSLTYEEIVKIAGMTGTPSMTWRIRRSETNTGGILSPGDRIPVQDGLVLNAYHTGNA